ncbi:Eco57I restriction-modification methylase domain-containing protein [Actinomadura bangladeshensis]|uniref:site-specific DNA-methyltransferase (adenine-specific) n=1 Tax=Actinomadura bangladeshensis TaxID=453573 RepID=A0A4R4P9J8_9ACTN|nr:Eco57I restriction-modification methylase domain-containing protein [Actinomadura bangladeshensis]TDC18494.1 SAM-dependent methyltransferase [Actinomadura bangladeshensis]
MLTEPGGSLADTAPHAGAAPVQYGEVFTRRWIVELILDLCGYSVDTDLTTKRLVEPAIGSGAFLMPVLDRLLEAREKYSPDGPWDELLPAILAMDVQPGHVRSCRSLVTARLIRSGCPAETANRLATAWVREGDFLLDGFPGCADYVVGNPPYIRIEDVAPSLLAAYRRACPTMGGRADVYIGFFERGLDLLDEGGTLAFICADRWMRNQYGRRLREKIIKGGFAVDSCLVMHDVAAFENEVSAYPAITVLTRGPQGDVGIGEAGETFDFKAAADFASWASLRTRKPLHGAAVRGSRLPHWHSTADSWPDGTPEALAWLEDLQDRHPPLEDREAGTRIGIGVATGADAVYITRDAEAAEPERMLPLAMSADVKSGTYDWTGHYLVNPWDEDGLVDLDEWPRLSEYLSRNANAILRRSISKRSPASWFRTIDRVTASLTGQPKLLLEDMKRQPNPVLEPGGHYPHHNLYYLVSQEWDLEVLGGLLLSEVVERQIAAYCVKMRGNTLRFQAQYLRRVHAPRPAGISADVADELVTAFRARDRAAATAAALRAYKIRALP